MQKSEITAGEEYAVREPARSDKPLQHVRILEHVRGKKWKAKWIEPNAGLVDYVESQNIIVRWKDRKAFLRDEQREREIQKETERQGYTPDSPLTNAVDEVLGATGDPALYLWEGSLSAPPDALARFEERARLEANKESTFRYVDRFGKVRLPFKDVLKLAKAFCAAEPIGGAYAD